MALLSAEFEAEQEERKICLELGCSATIPCRCKDCLCCNTCSASCDCVGATEDPDTALQRLLLPEPCYSYRLQEGSNKLIITFTKTGEDP
jgi:hypothetical protein